MGRITGQLLRSDFGRSVDQVLGPQITFRSIPPTTIIPDDPTIRPNTVFSAARNTKET